MPTPKRLGVAMLVVLAAFAWSLPIGAQTGGTLFPPKQACDDPDQAITLYAEKVGPGRYGYGLEPGKASVPGPSIQLTEGECVHINLVNDTDAKVSFHPHGVDYTVHSDGTGANTSCVPPGRSRTFVISSHPPMQRTDGTFDPGSAGYWHYHDHCRGTPHGTGGIRAGLFGALIVRRIGDPLPDRDPIVIVMGPEMNINDRTAPSRKLIFKANLGQRTEFVVIGHGDLFHTFHLHGHRWVNNRTGMPVNASDRTEAIDNKTVGPADSFGFQVVAGEHVGQGAWMYHCHVQGHSDMGMVGLFVVRGPDGKMNAQTRKAVERWIRIERAHHAGH